MHCPDCDSTVDDREVEFIEAQSTSGDEVFQIPVHQPCYEKRHTEIVLELKLQD